MAREEILKSIPPAWIIEVLFEPRTTLEECAYLELITIAQGVQWYQYSAEKISRICRYQISGLISPECRQSDQSKPDDGHFFTTAVSGGV